MVKTNARTPTKANKIFMYQRWKKIWSRHPLMNRRQETPEEANLYATNYVKRNILRTPILIIILIYKIYVSYVLALFFIGKYLNHYYINGLYLLTIIWLEKLILEWYPDSIHIKVLRDPNNRFLQMKQASTHIFPNFGKTLIALFKKEKKKKHLNEITFNRNIMPPIHNFTWKNYIELINSEKKKQKKKRKMRSEVISRSLNLKIMKINEIRPGQRNKKWQDSRST